MTSPCDKCPGAKSPFGPRTYRPCALLCRRYEWAADGLKPAIDTTAGVQSCPNFVARVA